MTIPPTFGYRQHVIQATKTRDSAHYDGLVEEYFPAGALTSAKIFSNAENPDQLADHIAKLTDSSSRFIDMTTCH